MEFGLFAVGDLTPDPVTGNRPATAQCLRGNVDSQLAQQTGLDVFRPPRPHPHPPGA